MRILDRNRNDNLLVQTRSRDLIKGYSSMGFNWHSVLRFQQDPKDISDHYTKVYKQKIGSRYVDRVMDNLVKCEAIDYAMAFVEQDDYHNNHMHFTWTCEAEVTRKQIASLMKTRSWYIRDVKPITDVRDAIAYFTKRLGKTGSYHNIYSNN